MAKMLAHSTPKRLPGNRAINPVTVIERNPSTGTDCRISRAGKITERATRGELEDISDAWRTWSESPDAWFAIVHGEIRARV